MKANIGFQNKTHTRLILLGILLLSFAACEKTISIDPPGYEDKMVVEGYIENDQYPYIYLSRNQSMFDSFDFSMLLDSNMNMEQLNALIAKAYAMTDTNAVMVITDGAVKDTLQRVSLMQIAMDFSQGKFHMPPIYWYSKKIKGEVGHSYYLDIFTEGKHLTSQVSIMPLFHNDSIGFLLKPNSVKYGNIMVTIHDDPNQRDYYRYEVKRMGKDLDYIPAVSGTFADDYFNGRTFAYPLYRGSGGVARDENDPDDNEENRDYFARGDTVVVKTCKLDKATYDFWNTFRTGTSAGFTEPQPIKTNINKGLGIFGAYAAVYDTVILR